MFAREFVSRRFEESDSGGIGKGGRVYIGLTAMQARSCGWARRAIDLSHVKEVRRECRSLYRVSLVDICRWCVAYFRLRHILCNVSTSAICVILPLLGSVNSDALRISSFLYAHAILVVSRSHVVVGRLEGEKRAGG